jgi:hypothetical protein
MLDKQSVKILRYLCKNPKSSKEILINAFGEDCVTTIQYLVNEHYIINAKRGFQPQAHVIVYKDEYSISPKGKSYLQHTPKETFMKISYFNNGTDYFRSCPA